MHLSCVHHKKNMLKEDIILNIHVLQRNCSKVLATFRQYNY